MKLPTKPSGATGENTRHGSDDTARRPPSVKAALSVSFGQRAPHRASTRDSSPVRRNLPPPPPYDRSNGDDVRRSPSLRRSQSRDREYSDKDRDQNRERDRERGRDQDRYHDRGRERDRERDRSRDRGRDRNRERNRDKDRRQDYDRRSRYMDKRDIDEGRRYRSRSRSPSVSGNRTRCEGEQGGNSHYEPQKEASKTSSNLAKLKDLYGDISDSKGDDAGFDRVAKRDNSGEEVIRLGGSTWK